MKNVLLMFDTDGSYTRRDEYTRSSLRGAGSEWCRSKQGRTAYIGNVVGWAEFHGGHGSHNTIASWSWTEDRSWMPSELSFELCL